MPTGRMGLAATVGADGRIYAIGGYGNTGVTNTVEAYTPGANTWAPVAPMPTARWLLAAATGPDGRIYAIGGRDGAGNGLGIVEAYTPATHSWATMAPMPTARDALAAATGPDGRIYAIGGVDSIGFAGTVEAYTPATNSWVAVAPMPTARNYLAAATGRDGRIYALGGNSDGYLLNTVEAYTPATNSWVTVAPMPTARSLFMAASGPDGRVYAIGGWNAGPLNAAEAYTPATNNWATLAPMPVARGYLAGATGQDGRVYAIGGYNSSSGYLNTVEAYTPSINRLASGVNLKLVEPSTIASNGAFEENISEVNPSSSNCGFSLYRYTSSSGGFQSLGTYSGTQTNDLVQDSFGYTQYAMVPRDCKGNTGAAVYSVGFVPTTLDNPFGVVSGSGTIMYSSRYYGGSALQTSAIGTRVRWSTDCSYNVGVVVGTGPEGGIGTVYVDGVKKGTINFYSAKLAGMRVLFKFGTSSGASHTVDVVTTGHGSGGGSFMNLDAGIENHC